MLSFYHHVSGNFVARLSVHQMKRIVLAIGSLSVLFAACQEKQKTLTTKEIKAKADSIIATRAEYLNKQASEDLDRRSAIEVKAKADSIVEAYKAAHPEQNTTPPQPIEPTAPPAQ